MLKHYTEQAKDMTTHALRFAVKDITETLKLWRDVQNEYTAKLYAEFDAYTVELCKRGA